MTGIRPTAVRTGAAHRLLPLAERILGARLPLRLRAWDGALAFEEGRMGVDQILAVRPSGRGSGDMPLTPRDWYAREGGTR
ncbi:MULTISPECIES: hypothetical protein [Streptomyces]|uniref:hypothetical protein n=1 Tax=Streptomyces sp. 4R-3d TaxID=2559605 RepID=UPI00084C931A|nr:MULTISPECIES: hypothetical protein [Streptomyces]TFI26923.1 hypothetical protein E4P36_15435 [Streptomyces sp. 4R-3d]